MEAQSRPPDPEDSSGRPKLSPRAIIVAAVVVIVLGGQMAFGVWLLWTKWHEPAQQPPRPEIRSVK